MSRLRWPSMRLRKMYILQMLMICFVICLNNCNYSIGSKNVTCVREQNRSTLEKLKTSWLSNFYLSVCPRIPPNLYGWQKITTGKVTIREAEGNVTGVKEGGFWSPQHCLPRWRVAIIVPYRDRPLHIGPFLLHMHLILQRQELNYSIYIVEQEVNKELFNRGRLLNVGYLEAQKEGPWDCVAFHDVDKIPEDDRHLFYCSQQPRHLAVATSSFGYKLPYPDFFGGACLMTKEQVESVNGWSNIFWGWGGEDDDMRDRIDAENWHLWRYRDKIARYKEFSHKLQKKNEQRKEMVIKNKGKYPNDGLNTLEYKIRNITRNPLFTHIVVNIGSHGEEMDVYRI